ncbi:extracellular solute-binding protein [Paenibacillus sp. KQZ6P-2]|uniref:Extracellular solute-binding protein n=1 Tax=Paenibacillus mangrovi TaxID=2931978 RepID=A0A9X2B0I3_9BACL|nr:extracellular solute-binding protein [Paenibacillus mangrovi]MCJ8010246.1 extracellular solute-binding protein [Paenibacillus mangrovi]
MFRKKSVLSLLSVFAITSTILAGCGSSSKDSSSTDAGSASANNTATSAAVKPVEFSFYFSGSQNVKDLWDTLIPMFEKQNPDIKVKPVFIPSGTGAQSTYDRILAAKQAGKGSGDIDLYEDGLSTITKGQKDDLWDTLSSGSIPNLSNVDQQTMTDVSNLAVPYRSSAVILAYNSEKVTEVPNTLDELYDWIRKHPGKFAYNDPSTGGSGNSFVMTALYKDLPEEAIHNSDPSIESQWDKGFALLKDLGKYVYGEGIYPKKNQGTLDLLANGEVDMIPAWSDMVLEQVANGQLPASTKIKQLTPGFNGGPTYLMVPKLSEKKDAVYKFLDFVLSPEAQTVVVNKMHGFPGIQLSNMPQEVQDSFKGASEGFRSFNIGDLDKDMSMRWQSEVAAQ